MSTENPFFQYPPANAPWAMVDMAAVMLSSSSHASPGQGSRMVLDDGLLSELMDLDASPEAWMAAAGDLGFSDRIVSLPQTPLSSKSVDPYRSLGTFSFDSTLLEELLAESDMTSLNFPATEKPADAEASRLQVVADKRSLSIERLNEALQIISRWKTDALAQVWMPVVKDNKLLLTTQEQPYRIMPPQEIHLMQYRSLSTGYVFPSEKDDPGLPGLPGRVFTRLAPEWTPNVQLYDSREYLRIRDAARCDVKGTLAVPVFDPSSRSCLGVIELVTTVEKIEYGTELSMICSALQAVNLAGAVEGRDVLLPQIRTEGREAVFAEISEVLIAVCETHKLALAQTWLPCVHNGKGSEEMLVTNSLGAGMYSGTISLIAKDGPYHVADPRFLGFHQACSEHRLDKGQGVAGKAFISNRPSFMHDIRSYSKEEYPLVHYARYFKLGAAVAIRLRSLYTGADDYILEFFLPPECSDGNEKQLLLNALSITMQRVCRSLRTVSEQELNEEIMSARFVEYNDENGSYTAVEEVPRPVSMKKHNTQSDVRLHRNKKTRQNGEVGLQTNMDQRDSSDAGDLGESAWSSSMMHEGGVKRRLERKRSISEKTISLDVLQQYFAGSLKDAAKSIGVCPTTLKRICRQYGISRWPSRKINKVSRSLIKLQGVIDSVQGIDGAVKLHALTGELASAAAAAAAITKKNSDKPAGLKSPNHLQACQTGEANGNLEAAGQDIIPSLCSDGREAYKDLSSDKSTEECNSREEVTVGAGVFSRSKSWLSQYLENDSTVMGETSLKPIVKIESRVHGSSAALAALTSGEDQFCDMETMATNPELNSGLRFEASSPEGHTSSPSASSGDCASPASLSGGANWKKNAFYALASEPSNLTVKATLGSDTVRFKLPSSFGYSRLREEISNRFRLEPDGFTLKYLDDDAEWVMLDGDADLDECLDVMKAAHVHTMKLVVRDRALCNTSSDHSLSSVKL